MFHQISPRHKVIAVEYMPELKSLFGVNHREAVLHGRKLSIVPHNSEAVILLRNLGAEIPAPIMSQYEWPGLYPPFEVQKETAAMLSTERRAFVLNSMGTGKTLAAIWAWHYLYSNAEAKRLMIVAPLSTLQFTWAKEIFRNIPTLDVVVLHGSKKKRLDLLMKPYDVYVINHDGLAVIADEMLAFGDHLPIDSIVFDELSAYKNYNAKRTKIARKICAKMKWGWGMTGSPTPNEPTDAYGQCTVINPSKVPARFTRFRDETMTKVSQFKWVPKPNALNTVLKAMQPSVRYTLEDVTELPDLIERTLEVGMGKHQSAVYGEMEKRSFVAYQNKEITAMNAGVVLNKLLQIASGYVYDSDRNVVTLDNEDRIRSLIDIVQSTDKKVLVFVPFKHALAGISAALTSEGIEHATVSGDVGSTERGDIFNAFQNTAKYKVIAAHPATMSHGLTLTAAATIVWFAPITSLETFEQANARIRRVGQKNKQQVIMLQSTKVERHIYKRLRAKQSVQDQLLNMFATGFADIP